MSQAGSFTAMPIDPGSPGPGNQSPPPVAGSPPRDAWGAPGEPALSDEDVDQDVSAALFLFVSQLNADENSLWQRNGWSLIGLGRPDDARSTLFASVAEVKKLIRVSVLQKLNLSPSPETRPHLQVVAPSQVNVISMEDEEFSTDDEHVRSVSSLVSSNASRQ